jgi:ribosomal protein S18 acetylase RimI-like enzyme
MVQSGGRIGQGSGAFRVGQARTGQGIAQELMHACIRELEQRGADAVWLGVWEHNPRAIAFYKKSGFVEVGNQVFPLGGDLQRDIVMARLAAA